MESAGVEVAAGDRAPAGRQRGRDVAIGRRTVAELGVRVAAPARQIAGCVRDRARVICAGRHGGPRVQRTDLLGREHVGHAVIAELAVLIAAPAPQRAIALDSARELVARADRAPRRGTDLLGRVRGVARTVAELTGRVRAPAPHRAVGLDAARPARARRDLRPAAGRQRHRIAASIAVRAASGGIEVEPPARAQQRGGAQHCQTGAHPSHCRPGTAAAATPPTRVFQVWISPTIARG